MVNAHLPRLACRAAVFLLVGIWLSLAACASDVPPVPSTYVMDQAGVLTPMAIDSLNARLDRYERETSTQIIIALFPRLPEREAVEDYAVKVFDAWKPGRKGMDNGLILFGFIQDRKFWIQTGYGAEARLPDSVCRRVIDLAIAPEFKRGNYAGGLTAALDAIDAALKGEYQGMGRTQAQAGPSSVSPLWVVIALVLLLLFLLWISRVGRMYGSGGVVDIFDIIFRLIFYVLQSGGGGSYRGGNNGGFSGGGGRTGGGGAGGEW